MNDYTFLQDYSQETMEKYSNILSHHIENIPYTLSYPIYQAVKKLGNNQYGSAMNHVLDFFEISTQYSSIILFGILKSKNGIEACEKTLTTIVNKIDFKRPLSFGDWVNDLFMPLLRTAIDYYPEHPFVKSLTNKAFSKKKNILIGGKKEASIVQIRNEYKGHSTTLSENIYKGVLYTLENRVLDMLEALSDLSNYDFYTLDKNNILWSMSGITPHETSPKEELRSKFQQSHYYMYRKDGKHDEIIDLYPLVFLNEHNYIYVFQSLKDENASYISSSEDALTLITDTLNDDIDNFFQEVVPSFDIAKELNWDELKSFTHKESTTFLNRIYKEKKYNQELFVDRKRLTDTLYQFWDSDKTLFPLLGEAGQGKTNQLCYWTEKLLERNNTVLIFNSSDFSSYTLSEKLNLIFGYNTRRDVTKLINSLHEKAAKNNSKIYIFFDAINECLLYKNNNEKIDGPLCLYKAITELLIKDKYNLFKVLFTCRSYTWKNVIQKKSQEDSKFIFNAGNEDDTAIRSFTKDETYRAYKIYQRLYQMSTNYEDLDKRTLIRLKDPLILKFVSSNFLGKELSKDTSEYTSLSLFDKMLNNIKNSYAGNLQHEIISCIGDYLLSKHLCGHPTDHISTEVIKSSYDSENSELNKLAHLIYKNDGITIAYTELLNKTERPIIKESERNIENGVAIEIRFIYERFLEFVMACSFLKKERANINDNNMSIPAEAYIKAINNSSKNVVFIGTIRNAIVMDCINTKDYSTIIKLVTSYSENYTIMQLIIEVMNLLIRENYEDILFELMNKMLSVDVPNSKNLINKINLLNKKIETNQADENTINEFNTLSKQIAPIKKLRKLASVSLINGILLTDYFNENLYKSDALSFLWRLMMDKIHDVRNDTCMYTYYLSNKTHTLDYSPLRTNLCEQIVHNMYSIIKSKPLILSMSRKYTRDRSIIFFETATRLGTLLIIDSLMSYNKNKDLVKNILQEIEDISKYLTFNFHLLRIFLPILQIIMRKQITFQATYVNNAIEYQSFWERYNSYVSSENEWNKECIEQAMSFIWHHSKYHNNKNSPECLKEEKRFNSFIPKILSAYNTGDSFTYFTLERILIIMGTSNWQNIKPFIDTFFTQEKYRNSEWFNYSQMSILYILFQISIYTKENNKEIIDIYTKESKIWTLTCKGIYKAPKSHKANPLGVYKRNVLTWYCLVHSHGKDDINNKVPLFYELIDIAIKINDKELLIHLIENISELITDFGYINTGMNLLKYILIQFDSETKVNKFDSVKTDRPGLYQQSLVSVIGNLLGTAKNYFQSEVDIFIKKDLIGLSFPGIAIYKDEILNYNPSGETLSDLFTHKFGKFLTWGLLFEESIDNFANEAMCTAVHAKDCFGWYDQVVKILLKYLFKIKL